jgi:hypothetical protein
MLSQKITFQSSQAQFSQENIVHESLSPPSLKFFFLFIIVVVVFVIELTLHAQKIVSIT